MASNRINRINEEIQKSLADSLRSVKDPRVADALISITRVGPPPTCATPRSMSASCRKKRPPTL